jgi:hypothetical protein
MISQTDLLDGFDEFLEDLGILDRHLREDLSIESDFLGLEGGDECAIGNPFCFEGVVETNDPQRTERSLLGSAIAAGIFSGLDDSFLGLGEELLAAPAIAFGLLQNVFVALLGHHAALDSGHTGFPLGGLNYPIRRRGEPF